MTSSVRDKTCQAEELPGSSVLGLEKLLDTSMPCPNGDMELEINEDAGS